eukprot:TRINITY_DN2856_c0_g1_i6.p2 TRINITY_DN2856_c0_g1~~TRINITY_DN2856_c0_g1_i6.p2  ORF type:complete len:207 (+),score=20.02 TRINITY_DN2856_c0_g1_i6:122-742(+)
MNQLVLIFSVLLICAVSGRVSEVYDNCDPKWTNDIIEEKTTICSDKGTLLSVLADILTNNGLTCNSTEGCTPRVVNSFMKANGGFKPGFTDLRVLEPLGLKLIKRLNDWEIGNYESFSASSQIANFAYTAFLSNSIVIVWDKYEWFRIISFTKENFASSTSVIKSKLNGKEIELRESKMYSAAAFQVVKPQQSLKSLIEELEEILA